MGTVHIPTARDRHEVAARRDGMRLSVARTQSRKAVLCHDALNGEFDVAL